MSSLITENETSHTSAWALRIKMSVSCLSSTWSLVMPCQCHTASPATWPLMMTCYIANGCRRLTLDQSCDVQFSCWWHVGINVRGDDVECDQCFGDILLMLMFPAATCFDVSSWSHLVLVLMLRTGCLWGIQVRTSLARFSQGRPFGGDVSSRSSSSVWVWNKV